MELTAEAPRASTRTWWQAFARSTALVTIGAAAGVFATVSGPGDRSPFVLAAVIMGGLGAAMVLFLPGRRFALVIADVLAAGAVLLTAFAHVGFLYLPSLLALLVVTTRLETGARSREDDEGLADEEELSVEVELSVEEMRGAWMDADALSEAGVRLIAPATAVSGAEAVDEPVVGHGAQPMVREEPSETAVTEDGSEMEPEEEEPSVTAASAAAVIVNEAELDPPLRSPRLRDRIGAGLALVWAELFDELPEDTDPIGVEPLAEGSAPVAPEPFRRPARRARRRGRAATMETPPRAEDVPAATASSPRPQRLSAELRELIQELELDGVATAPAARTRPPRADRDLRLVSADERAASTAASAGDWDERGWQSVAEG